jgi:hypothetical protein
MQNEQRKVTRKDLSYYMPVVEAGTERLLGVMTNISPGGFKLESRELMEVGRIDHFRIDLIKEITPKAAMDFVGRSQWCRPDPYDPSSFNAGFQIVDISMDNAVIYQRIYEKCLINIADEGNNKGDYLWQ